MPLACWSGVLLLPAIRDRSSGERAFRLFIVHACWPSVIVNYDTADKYMRMIVVNASGQRSLANARFHLANIGSTFRS